MLSREEAAKRLGMKVREVTDVRAIRGVGHVVTTHDGIRTIVHDEGGLTFLRPSDQLPDSADGVLVDATEATGGAPSEPVDPVPTGNAEQVLAWVGDNPERAARALKVEQASAKPCSTLVAALEKLAG